MNKVCQRLAHMNDRDIFPLVLNISVLATHILLDNVMAVLALEFLAKVLSRTFPV